jgi:hypothetical protein
MQICFNQHRIVIGSTQKQAVSKKSDWIDEDSLK